MSDVAKDPTAYLLPETISIEKQLSGQKGLDECFATRDILCHMEILDNEKKEQVRFHFDHCCACQEWAKKRDMKWRPEHFEIKIT